jgi:hypothetical protein
MYIYIYNVSVSAAARSIISDDVAVRKASLECTLLCASYLDRVLAVSLRTNGLEVVAPGEFDILTYMHTYIHTYMHSCMHTFIHTSA